MNLPNKLTMLRLLLIPVFLGFFFLARGGQGTWGYLAAFIVFVAASYTDHLDGAIARKRGLVTDFGKLMDPLADKILVMSAMICLLAAETVHPVAVIVILAREFLVTAIRTVGAGKGVVIEADNWGKAKTVAQMIWIGLGLFLLWLPASILMGAVGRVLVYAYYGLMVIVLVLTIISGLNYTVKNRALFRDM